MLDRAVLDGIRIASPCPASWDEMVGDGRKRFCSACRKEVYDLSAMTTEAALALVTRDGEAPCVQFYRRADRTVMTSDCPVGATKLRHRMIRRTAGVGLIGVVMAWTWASMACRAMTRRYQNDTTRSGNPMPNLSGSSVDVWVNWSLISIGVRTPPVMTRGEVMSCGSIRILPDPDEPAPSVDARPHAGCEIED